MLSNEDFPDKVWFTSYVGPNNLNEAIKLLTDTELSYEECPDPDYKIETELRYYIEEDRIAVVFFLILKDR